MRLILFSVGTLLLALVGVHVVPEPIKEAPVPIAGGVESLVAASVLVKADDGSGSGVAYHNGDSVFIWTAAHVVEGQLKIKTVIDPATGRPAVRVSFNTLQLSQDVYAAGVESGREVRQAVVVRYGESDDIALLRVVGGGWPAGGVEFGCHNLPGLGMPVWHVGSMRGFSGTNSLTDGIVSTVGRLRDGLPYDQASVPCYPGSSGGGVFRKSDNKCLGIVSQGIASGAGNGAILYVPARRIRDYALRTNCEWALDRSRPVPAFDGERVVTDDLELPKEWREPEPTKPPVVFPFPPPIKP